MQVNFSPEHKRIIKSRIKDYRKYDQKRFGTCKDSITYEEYLELVIEQEGKCYWTGREMQIMGDSKLENVSLDRLHCHLPHTKDNCILCQRALNLGRNDSSIRDWVLWLESMNILSPALQQELDTIRTTSTLLS